MRPFTGAFSAAKRRLSGENTREKSRNHYTNNGQGPGYKLADTAIFQANKHEKENQEQSQSFIEKEKTKGELGWGEVGRKKKEERRKERESILPRGQRVGVRRDRTIRA